MQRYSRFVVFPGGPGLSTRTLEPFLELLPPECEVLRIDLPCDVDIASSRFKNYRDVVDWISLKIEADDDQANLVMIGHSYGSIFAADVAVRLARKTVGFLAIASPMSSKLKLMLDIFQRKLCRTSPEFEGAWRSYMQFQSPDTYRALAAEYIAHLSDSVSIQSTLHRLFADDVPAPLATRFWQKRDLEFPPLQNAVTSLLCPKLAILGNEDRLVPIDEALQEFRNMGFVVETVPGGHFPFLESTKQVKDRIQHWLG